MNPYFLLMLAVTYDGDHVELEQVRGGDEVLDALRHGDGRGREGGVVLDGGRDAGNEEAVECGGAVHLVGPGEVIEPGDNVLEGGG